MSKPHGKNAFFFVIVCVTLDMLAFGIFIPVMPAYLEQLTGLEARDAVVIGGYLMVTFGIVNFLTMPIIGNLSDRFGRRPVLLISMAGLCIDFIIMGSATTVLVLFIGRALAGLTSATYSTANSYIADVTEPEERGRAFGMIGAAFGIGFILGPVIGGLLGEVNIRLPFFVSAAIAACNVAYGLFVLPESLDKENRRPFELRRANPFGSLKHFSKVPQVGWFIVAMGLFALAHAVFPGSWNYYGAIRYDWGEFEIAISLALVGLGSALVQMLLAGPANKKLGPIKAAVLGLSINIVSMFLFSASVFGWMAYCVIVISSFGGIAQPAMQTLMTGVTPKNAQGELQGALASVQSLAGVIIGPFVMTQVLSYFAQPEAPVTFLGANFFLSGTLALIAMLPLFLGIRANREKVHELEEEILHPETHQTNENAAEPTHGSPTSPVAD